MLHRGRSADSGGMMRWFYRTKQQFLIRMASIVGIGNVIVFCMVSCNSNLASQESQIADTVEIRDNATALSETDTNVPQPEHDIVKAEDVTNTDTTNPEDTNNLIVENNVDASQSAPDTDKVVQDNQDTPKPENIQQDSTPKAEETTGSQGIPSNLKTIQVVSEGTEGAIKIEYHPRYAELSVNSKVICKQSPCYVLINDPKKRIKAELDVPGWKSETIVIDGSQPTNTFRISSRSPSHKEDHA